LYPPRRSVSVMPKRYLEYGKGLTLQIDICDSIDAWLDHGLEAGSFTMALIRGQGPMAYAQYLFELKARAHPHLKPHVEDHMEYMERLACGVEFKAVVKIRLLRREERAACKKRKTS
jgi:hypothetical protein